MFLIRKVLIQIFQTLLSNLNVTISDNLPQIVINPIFIKETDVNFIKKFYSWLFFYRLGGFAENWWNIDNSTQMYLRKINMLLNSRPFQERHAVTCTHSHTCKKVYKCDKLHMQTKLLTTGFNHLIACLINKCAYSHVTIIKMAVMDY